MPTAISADGTQHVFPDGTDQSVIDKIMKDHVQPKGQGGYSLGDVPIAAATNLLPSAGRFAKSVAQPFIHPIETAKNIGNVALGYGEKALGVPQVLGGHQQYADAVNKFFVDRYGGYENVKRTIAEDPVGFAADISSVFTAGGGALRATGLASEVAEAASKVGRVTNPLTAVGKIGDIASAVIGNMGTGSGAQGIKDIARAGFKGGAESKAALENMRQPEAHQSAIVAQARKALGEVRAERSADYQAGMAGVGKVQKPLNFDEIDKALTKAARIKSIGGVPVSKLAGMTEPLAAESTLTKIWTAVQNWKRLPSSYHTPANMDALKQLVGEIKDGLQFGTPERKIAEEAYGAIRETIVKQAPEYANVMKDYEQASTLITELEKTLSLGKKASEDTALRKLLSTTRSNVNTNFGKRAELSQELGRRDPTLIPALAGQSLSSWTPAGLVGKGVAGSLAAGAGFGAHPLAALGLPFTSPRLVGEAAHALGRGAGSVKQAIPPELLRRLAQINPDVLRQVLLLTSRVGQNASQ